MSSLSTVLTLAVCFLRASANYNGGAAAYNNYAVAGGPEGRWTGPLAKPVVTPSGFLAETPEVAAARASHLGLVAGAAGFAGSGYAGTGYTGAGVGYAGSGYAPTAPAEAPTPRWTGPLASPKVSPSGFLVDTPEVAAARAAHLNEVGRAGAGGYAGAPAGYAGGYAGAADDGQYRPGQYGGHY